MIAIAITAAQSLIFIFPSLSGLNIVIRQPITVAIAAPLTLTAFRTDRHDAMGFPAGRSHFLFGGWLSV